MPDAIFYTHQTSACAGMCTCNYLHQIKKSAGVILKTECSFGQRHKRAFPNKKAMKGHL